MFLVTLAAPGTRLLITMEGNLQQRTMIMMAIATIVLCYILVPGGLVAVIIAIPMVSMVITDTEKESTGAHGRVFITLSNIFSSKYVEPESVSVRINFMYELYAVPATFPLVYTHLHFVHRFLWSLETPNTVQFNALLHGESNITKTFRTTIKFINILLCNWI